MLDSHPPSVCRRAGAARACGGGTAPRQVCRPPVPQLLQGAERCALLATCITGVISCSVVTICRSMLITVPVKGWCDFTSDSYPDEHGAVAQALPPQTQPCATAVTRARRRGRLWTPIRIQCCQPWRCTASQSRLLPTGYCFAMHPSDAWTT